MRFELGRVTLTETMAQRVADLDRADRGLRGISRRAFLQASAASGITLTFTRLAAAEEPGFDARETLPGRGQWNPAATAAGRIDGVAKVTGAKLYPSDFRAADMPGWPSRTSHALLLRTDDAAHVFAGLDLSLLNGAAKPAAIVAADDLVWMPIRVPEFYAGDLFCPAGKTPLYLGQPIALLIFEDFDAFDEARLALRDRAFAKFGEETGPVEQPNYGAYRFTRVGGPTPEAPDIYSPVKNGWVTPDKFQKAQNTEVPIWPREPPPTWSAYSEAAGYGEQIRAELAADDPALLVLEREFDTQSVDPMFLEPESGLAWYEVEQEDTRARRRRPVALRGRPLGRIPAWRSGGGVPADAHRDELRLLRRRVWRAGTYAVPAVPRFGGDGLSRSPRPARQQSPRSVSIRNQAARLQDEDADRG